MTSPEPPQTDRAAADGRLANLVTWGIRVVLALTVIVFVVVGLRQAGRDAPTVDEGVDVSSGVATLVRHDLRMVPEHPPLGKVVAAAPALLAHPIVPRTEAWYRGDWFDWSDDFIAANEADGRLHDTLLYARAVVIVECLAAAALIAALARRHFGPDGAALAALAWLTIPYVVGLGHFAMIDLPFVVVTLGVSLLLARWSDRPSMPRTIALGAGVAAALCTRHTGLVLAMLVAVVVLHRRRAEPRAAARDLGVVVLAAVVGTWLVYRGLAPGGSSPSVRASFEGLIGAQGDASLSARVVGALPMPLEWRAGFAYLDYTSTARPASLLGQSWDGGRWWYFPVSAAVKIPLTTIAPVVFGWLVAIRGRHRRSLATFVVAPALLLWLFLVFQPLNLGLRLAMPTVALAMVGVGALGLDREGFSSSAITRTAWVAIPLRGAVFLGLAAVLVSAPHSLAWTPPPWTPAYRWVSDANLDAGQGLYELRDWATHHGHPYVAYDSTRGLSVRGGSRPLSSTEPQRVRGWVAVGVTPLMQTRRAELAWLRKYCPVATLAGGSILVYRFDAAPDPTPGPERPVGPCFGAARSTAG